MRWRAGTETVQSWCGCLITPPAHRHSLRGYYVPSSILIPFRTLHPWSGSSLWVLTVITAIGHQGGETMGRSSNLPAFPQLRKCWYLVTSCLTSNPNLLTGGLSFPGSQAEGLGIREPQWFHLPLNIADERRWTLRSNWFGFQFHFWPLWTAMWPFWVETKANVHSSLACTTLS